ncbi:protein kinase family protein [Neobacillus dielmonensis]|uniref:hypothetical protein n=1 Tax=Neobacillus dielmonensis TaxID=1347369 RepID=UPI0005A77DC9|nr:hypothetical protein [Neobacillus dielmonensis]
MADINQYRTMKELYTSEHLTVYQAEDTSSGEITLIRQLNKLAFRDSWKDLYRFYGNKITNYKYLPSVKRIDELDDSTYAVLGGSEGNLLEKGQILTGSQIDQLLEAFIHLHQNNIVHGKISRFHIWIKESGGLTLYGAGERSVLYPETKLTFQDDINQLITLLRNHSKINNSYFEGIGFETIEDLQEWALSKLAFPKPGLVNKGVTANKVFGEPAKVQQTKDERKEPVPIPFQASPENSPKQNSLLKWLVPATVLLMIVMGSIWALGLNDSAVKKANGNTVKTPAAAKNTTTMSAQKAEAPKNGPSFDLSQFAELFPGWQLIKGESIKLAGTPYTLVAAAQKRDDLSGVVKIGILTEANGSMTKVWESSEYASFLAEPTDYIQSFLTITQSDQQKGLLVFDLPDNGSLGIASIYGLMIQPGGSAEQVWTGPGFGIKKQNDVITVMDIGVKNLSLSNGQFSLEEKSRSESAPADAQTFLFDIDASGAVIPVNDKEITVKVGDKLAFIPANNEAKRKFDQGEISIYTDVYTTGSLSLANAYLLDHGNYVEFDTPGEFHFVLEAVGGPELNVDHPFPTFTARVKK